MIGFINKITTHEGKRDEVSTQAMPLIAGFENIATTTPLNPAKARTL